MNTPSLAFDTAALISLGHTDCIQHIIDNFNIVITQTIIDELTDISKFNDKDAIAAKNWLKHSKKFTKKKSKKLPTGEEELFHICKMDRIPLVSDDIRAVKKFRNDIDCYFSVHIIYALYKKNIISKTKGMIEIAKMKQERSWKQNAISIAGRILFK